MKRNNEFSTMLETNDVERIKRFVAHASIMISEPELGLYPLEDTTVATTDSGWFTLVVMRNLTQQQFERVRVYFYAVEFSLSLNRS